MRIHRLELASSNLAAQQAFYGDTLGLTITRADRAAVELMIGTSRLMFRNTPQAEGMGYHFAFTIPRNLFREAKAWLTLRTPLICDPEGQDEFFFKDWDAEAVYFADPAGNVVELIARHSLDVEKPAPFAVEHWLAVSEIGIGVPDARAAATLLQERTKIAPYQPTNDTFIPMGTHDGLLILVTNGREWFPNTGVPAGFLPVEALISHQMREYTLLSVPQGIVFKV